jgi:hypothetical protein
MLRMFLSCSRRWLKLLMVSLLAGGSLAAHAIDTYDPVSGILTIPLVIVGNTAYINVQVFVPLNNVLSPGTLNDPNANLNAPDQYSTATGELTIGAVRVGNNLYTNAVVAAALSDVRAVGAVMSTPVAPWMALFNPLAPATVGTFYSANVVAAVAPASRYTFGIDTLANGVLPTGMTIDLNGNLSGTPFATGRTDINGHQIPNTYTFGVCATDTFSRATTFPCPQTSIIVNPAPVTLTVAAAGTGSGTVVSVPAGVSCRGTCTASAPSGTSGTLTAVPDSGSTFAGWSGACSGTGPCALTLNATTSVTATFNTEAHSLAGTWQWSGPGSNGCFFNDGGAFSMRVTLNGSTFSASNVSAGGVETRNDLTCDLMSVDTHSGGTGSGTISGSTVTINFTVPGTSLTFNGTGTISGTTVTIPIVRTTGGSGTLNLTLQ